MMASDAPLYDPNHTRILVLGSMGAGKTTLVHALCHDGVVLHRPKTTVGCNVDIKVRGFPPMYVVKIHHSLSSLLFAVWSPRLLYVCLEMHL